MKIDRRAFLSFLAGGAVGTALSPLPWKLMDDVSIWSQNWPWVPVPRGGKSTYMNGTCSLCSGTCGIDVRKVGDRVVKIDGSSKHPINDGGICPLGLSGLQLLYSPTRIKSPMKLVGTRGSNEWENISWEEAYSIIIDRLKDVRINGDSHKIACVTGYSDNSVLKLIERFLKSYGSSNIKYMPSSDKINRSLIKHFFGVDGIINFDFENSDFVLSMGSGLLDGWGSPLRTMKVLSHWKNHKVRVVHVEPNMSNSIIGSSQWVPITPGTEADLLFGIATFMINSESYDVNFVNERMLGFNEWKEMLLKKYSLNSVSHITGIDIKIITELSESFINACNPVVLYGRGNGNIIEEYRYAVSVYMLNVLRGNINRKGGLWIHEKPSYMNWPDLSIDDVAKISLKSNQRVGDYEGFGVDDCDLFSNDDLFSVSSLCRGDLEFLMVVEANPCYTTPGSKLIKDFFRRVPFVVSFSSFMDETVMESDLVLPNNIYLERLEEIPVSTKPGEIYVSCNENIVRSQFNTRHIGDTIIDIANKFGGSIAESFPWFNYKDCLKDILSDKWWSHNDNSWVGEKLKVIDVWKFSFTMSGLESFKFEGEVDLFPLLFLPYDSIYLSSEYNFSPPFMFKIVPDTVLKGNINYVNINPETAKKLGLVNDDYAILSTPKGSAKVRAYLCNSIKPGVITMLRGLGHSAYDKYVAGKGTNVNDLIWPVNSSIYSNNSAYGIRAKLVKV